MSRWLSIHKTTAAMEPETATHGAMVPLRLSAGLRVGEPIGGSKSEYWCSAICLANGGCRVLLHFIASISRNCCWPKWMTSFLISLPPSIAIHWAHTNLHPSAVKGEWRRRDNAERVEQTREQQTSLYYEPEAVPEMGEREREGPNWQLNNSNTCQSPWLQGQALVINLQVLANNFINSTNLNLYGSVDCVHLIEKNRCLKRGSKPQARCVSICIRLVENQLLDNLSTKKSK